MKALLVVVLLLSVFVPAHAAVTLAVSQQSGPAAREQASLLAGKIGSVLKAPVKVVELPDHGQVEAWLNRFATADLALFETSHVAGKPGQFVTIGPAGEGLTLVGRQGIAGDLPRNIAAILGGGEAVRVDRVTTRTTAPTATRPLAVANASVSFSPSKSIEEDRYFVTYVYREKLNRRPEPDRLDYWAGQLHSGALTRQQLFDRACSPEETGCSFK